MSNNLQALKALRQSAVQQNKELESSIKEIHEQSMKQLSEDFRSTTSKKLNSIERNINKTMQDIREQNKLRYNFKHLLMAISTTALIFLFVGMILADYTPRMSEKVAWTVPQEYRVKVEGMEYIKVEKSKLLINNSTPDYRYIKITEK